MQIDRLKVKLRLACGDSFAIGPGKADLLDAIAREGSIAAAGRAMGVSYRRAWLLVDEMNRCFRGRVVETLAGGGRERGARLTEQGRRMLTAYRTLEAAAAALADSDAYRILNDGIAELPVPAQTP